MKSIPPPADPPAEPNSRLRPGKTALFGLLLILILAAGVLLRFYNLSKQSYWMDEGYTVNAVLSVLEHGSTVLNSGQLYYCPLYCYPDAWLAHLFGANAFDYRLLAVLAGIAFILAVYRIVSDLFSPGIGIAASFLTAFSYWQIAWSRQARWYTLFELFLWLSLYLFYKALYGKGPRFWYAVSAAAATILAILASGLGYVLPVLFFIWFALDRIIRKKSLRWGLMGLAAALVLGGFALWFAGLFPALVSLIKGIRPSYELPYYLNFYLRTYWLFVPFAVFALFDAGAHYRKQIWFLLAAFIAYLIPLSFFTDIVQYRYLFAVTPVLLILGAVGVSQAARYFKRDWQKISLWTAFVAVFLFIGGGVWHPTSYYFLESDNPSTLGPRPHYAYTPQPDWNGTYAYIETHVQNGDIVISSMPQFNEIFLNEPGYWIAYNYLGLPGQPSISNSKESYVGAQVIKNLQGLQSLTASRHGFIIFDYMAADGRMSQDILQFIKTDLKEVFYENTNAYSQIWVYRF
ncbi:MAG: glycosyltransferase family 39 protein [Minisyncoccia bacterium]|jgi:hypothetical protein